MVAQETGCLQVPLSVNPRLESKISKKIYSYLQVVQRAAALLTTFIRSSEEA